MLTQKRLKELLYYAPNTGFFWWKVDRPGKTRKGDLAGSLNNDGYIQITIDGKSYKAARLTFLYTEGYFPENEVDHHNKIRTDNRWKNLRESSHQCNMRNRNLQINNTSGVTGVNWCKGKNKWRSEIKIMGKRKNLGRYAEFDEAVCTRLAAEQCLDWNGCNDSSSAFKYVQKILRVI